MDFKGRAKSWDNDRIIKRSEIIANKINELVGNKPNSYIMEYGCATGLISLNLCHKFKKLTLMDSEEEMIKVVNEKIKLYKTSNVSPIKIDLTKETYEKEKFDLIYTSLTLHHVLDIENIVKIFYSLLNKNGILCIIELDKEDGSFHGDVKNFKGHNGFLHKDIENTLRKVGFSNLNSETFFHGERTYDEKHIPYSIFYTIGEKL